jgi:hypothetical protein
MTSKLEQWAKGHEQEIINVNPPRFSLKKYWPESYAIAKTLLLREFDYSLFSVKEVTLSYHKPPKKVWFSGYARSNSDDSFSIGSFECNPPLREKPKSSIYHTFSVELFDFPFCVKDWIYHKDYLKKTGPFGPQYIPTDNYSLAQIELYFTPKTAIKKIAEVVRNNFFFHCLIKEQGDYCQKLIDRTTLRK